MSRSAVDIWNIKFVTFSHLLMMFSQIEMNFCGMFCWSEREHKPLNARCLLLCWIEKFSAWVYFPCCSQTFDLWYARKNIYGKWDFYEFNFRLSINSQKEWYDAWKKRVERLSSWFSYINILAKNFISSFSFLLFSISNPTRRRKLNKKWEMFVVDHLISSVNIQYCYWWKKAFKIFIFEYLRQVSDNQTESTLDMLKIQTLKFLNRTAKCLCFWYINAYLCLQFTLAVHVIVPL